MKPKQSRTDKLTYIALFTALATISVMFLRVPNGVGGIIHPGDSIIYITAIFFGPLAGAFVGGGADVDALFRRAKGCLEALPRITHCESFVFERKEKPHYADETVWLNITLGGAIIGNLALLSKKCALACGIKNHAAVLFEFSVDALKPFASRENKFVHLPPFPTNEYDLSLLLDASVKWEDISAEVLSKKGEGNILRGVDFVDEYRGKQIPDGKKSVTLRLTLGSTEKTLTSADIENFANSAVKRLQKKFSAEVRGK